MGLWDLAAEVPTSAQDCMRSLAPNSGVWIPLWSPGAQQEIVVASNLAAPRSSFASSAKGVCLYCFCNDPESTIEKATPAAHTQSFMCNPQNKAVKPFSWPHCIAALRQRFGELWCRAPSGWLYCLISVYPTGSIRGVVRTCHKQHVQSYPGRECHCQG